MPTQASKKYLIINADDFGLTEEISLAILQALKRKAVTDTNAITTSEHSKSSLLLAKNENILSMGVHLNLEIGNSLYYNRDMSFLNRLIGTDEYYKLVENEFNEQIEYLSRFEIDPTHLTYHKNIINNYKMVNIIKRIAIERNMPIRRIMSEKLNNLLIQEDILMCDTKLINTSTDYSKQELKNLLLKAQNSLTSELVCHPGFVSNKLFNLSSMTYTRENEYSLFTSLGVQCMIKKMGFCLINYKELKDWFCETKK